MNLFDLFATINLDSSNYEEGLNNAEDKTQSFGSKLQGGLSKAAKVTTAAIGAVSAAGAALAGTMVKGAAETAVYGDNIDKMSQKMGISAQAYQEWDAILQHSGSSIESLRASMKTLATAAESGNDAFEKLGISQEEIASLSQEDLFSKVISGLQQMEEGTERTYLTGQLLGRGATELGALLNTSAEETEAMRRRVHELGGVMSDEAVKSSAAFQDNLQDLQTAFSGIKRGIASDLLPGLSSLMAGFTSLIAGEDGAEDAMQSGFDSVLNSITSGVGKIASIGQKIIPALVMSIVTALPKLASSAVNILTVLGQALVQNAPMIVSSVIEILKTLGDSIVENLPLITEMISQAISEIALILSNPETLGALLLTVMTILQTIGTSLIENMPLLMETVFQVIDNIILFITENLPMFIDMAVKIIMALVDGFIAALPTLLAQIPVIISNITNALLERIPEIVQAGIKLLTALVTAMPQIISAIVAVLPQIITAITSNLDILLPAIIDAGITLFVALIDAMPQILDTIVGALPEIIDNIVNGLLNMLPQIIDAGIKLLTALIENLPQIIATIVSKLPQIISAIVRGIIGAVPKLMEAGGQLIKGLWQGISNIGEWLRSKISGFFSNIVGGIKKFFGISSPSKLFAGIGEMLDKGLAKGIDDYADVAVRATENMSDDVADAMNPDLDFTGSVSGTSGAAQRNRGLVINVYGSEGQNVEELAEIVSQKIAFGYSQEQAVFA